MGCSIHVGVTFVSLKVVGQSPVPCIQLLSQSATFTIILDVVVARIWRAWPALGNLVLERLGKHPLTCMCWIPFDAIGTGHLPHQERFCWTVTKKVLLDVATHFDLVSSPVVVELNAIKMLSCTVYLYIRVRLVSMQRHVSHIVSALVLS